MQSGSSDIRGLFNQGSFSQLLVRALDERWTGTLVIEPAAGAPSLLEIDAGLVSRALVSDEYARLGELMVDAGVIMQAELDLALAREGLLGQALAAERIIDAKTLQRALVLQVIKRLVRLFSAPEDTEWTYLADREAFAGMPDGVRVDTLRVLWAGISAHGEMDKPLRLVLTRIGESPFGLRSDVHVNRFGFTGDAARLVGVLNGERTTLVRLIAQAITPSAVVERIVYLLAITRHLEFLPAGDGVESAEPISTASWSSDAETPISSDASGDAQRQRVARIRLRRVTISRGAAPDPPGAGEPISRTSSDAVGGAPAGSGRREATGAGALAVAEIKGVLARLETETPLSLLALAASDFDDKNEEQVTALLWSALEQQSGRWDPGRCAGELGDLRQGVAKLREAVAEAFTTLLDPGERSRCLAAARGAGGPTAAGYTARGETGGSRSPDTIPSPAELPINSPPAARGRGAKVASGSASEAPEPPESGRRRMEGLSASQLHERALVAFSEQRVVEAAELCDHARAQAPDNPDYAASAVWIRAAVRRPDLKVLVLDLDELLRVHPDHVAARYYRGALRRRMGNDSAAKLDFNHVLEIDAEHAGARAQLVELGAGSRRSR